jgi:hypothetical protein
VTLASIACGTRSAPIAPAGGKVLKLFSVDVHIVEPADVWSKRLPQKYQAKGPHVIEADGRPFWVYEDQRSATMGLNAVAGKAPEEWGTDPVRFTDLIPGCYEISSMS